jgi:hypothetical protein
MLVLLKKCEFTLGDGKRDIFIIELLYSSFSLYIKFAVKPEPVPPHIE